MTEPEMIDLEFHVPMGPFEGSMWGVMFIEGRARVAKGDTRLGFLLDRGVKVVEKPAEEPKGLTDLTIPELRAKAKELGIEIPKDAKTRIAIAAVIEAAQTTANIIEELGIETEGKTEDEIEEEIDEAAAALVNL